MSSNITSAIDSMVADSARNVSTGPLARTTQDLRVDNEGTVTPLGPPVADKLPDVPGYDPMSEVAIVAASVSNLEAKLAEQSFDPATGAASPKLTGRDRELAEIALASARNSHAYAAQRAAALFGQREAEAERERQAKAEDVARHQFAQGSPERAAELDAAIRRAEADEAARAIVASRRRAG
jgi:hypothetical protein